MLIKPCVHCVGEAQTGRSAYIRYVVPTPDDQEATVEYDLDEEDEEWLQKHNSRVRLLSAHQETSCCRVMLAVPNFRNGQSKAG